MEVSLGIQRWTDSVDIVPPGAIPSISRQESSSEYSQWCLYSWDCAGEPDVIIIATGSEVAICREATKKLQADGVATRLVSMPSADVFDRQDPDYREHVLPATVRKRLAVEAASTTYWSKYIGLDGKAIGMDRFGESAPGGVLMEHFGFTADNVVAVAKSFD